MTIIQQAKQRIRDNEACDVMDFSENNKIIEGLLLEIKCLNIQVCDRGNSYQKIKEDNDWQIKQNVRMFKVIQEAVKYLDTNKLTNIMYGSIIHQKLKDALVIE